MVLSSNQGYRWAAQQNVADPRDCRGARGAAAQDGCFAYIAAEHPDDGGSGGAAGPPIDDDLDDG